MIVTNSYIQNIIDRSKIEKTEYEGVVILAITLPNTYVLVVSGYDEQECLDKARERIFELEVYLNLDKETYGYEFEGEYE